MGYLGRRIGLSQDKGDSTPGGADGAVGGGILDLFASGYFQREGNIYNAPGIVSGLTATGGIINDYTSGSDIYRAHIFVSSGTFTVTRLATNPDIPSNIEYLVVGGGGGAGGAGGGNAGTGGGGAGGVRTNYPGVQTIAGNNISVSTAYPVSAGPTSYAVIVGAGGAGGAAVDDSSNTGRSGSVGGISVFDNGGPTPIRSEGGGASANSNSSATDNIAGASGGGASESNPGPGNKVAGPPSGSAATGQQGHAGGNNSYNPPLWAGGGGGGAGAVGGPGPSSTPNTGYGGAGVQVLIAGPEASDVAGVPGPGGQGGWFAGGGGGGVYSNTAWAAGGSYNGSAIIPGGPYSGGGKGGGNDDQSQIGDGTPGTGGGGGGTGGTGSGSNTTSGGNGGSGVVVVRYQIGTLDTGAAKATGGAISFYGGKTIHTFTSSGTFATTSDWSAATVEYVVIGGGGAGGGVRPAGYYNDAGGGGGAGSYRTGTTPIGAHPVSTSIQVGAGGAGQRDKTAGTPSYFGTPITAPAGGGGGAGGDPPPSPPKAGGPGGSGGGGSSHYGDGTAGPATGASFPGTIGTTPASGWGHNGGAGGGSQQGGGGGGAGGAGAAGSEPPNQGGPGGTGIQLPSTFRDPGSSVGAPGPSSPGVTGADTSGKYYVAAGGGGGGGQPSGTGAAGGAGGGGAGGDGGAPPIHPGTAGLANTGSGGGGAGNAGDPPAGNLGGSGGSGIVLIAYPT